ncbi:MAG: HAMP domain-containing histidine kinase [Oscillospiraceae bacterium]|jgi:signal transduction histidine kinase|nr:HAMP domain-containing histidine kinase [Oscillospiraceae bacterium]
MRKDGGGAAGAGRVSIARKLSFRLFRRLLGALVSVDILICLITVATVIIYSERRAYETVSNTADAPPAGVGVTAADEGDGEGYIFFGEPLNRVFPYATSGAGRRLIFGASSFFDVLGPGSTDFSLDYALYFRASPDGSSYGVRVVSVPLGGFARSFSRAFCALLVIELIMLAVKTAGDGRFVRKLLRPITELARTARSLSDAGVAAPHTALAPPDTERVAALVRGLEGIDAARIDTRIPTDGAQRELRELAVAINGMLDRITQSYKAQARFVSDASHELRTPISVIAGYANLLDRWGKNDEKTLTESIAAIKDEAEGMRALVEQLLFLARGDGDAIPLDIESFDLSDVAESVFAEMRMTSRAHAFVSKPGGAPVRADRQLIKRLIRILVDNSIKNTDPGGQISFNAFTDGGYSKISISDDGIGISPEILPRIFDRFVRADESRARSTGGAGLGLPIALWIARRHGGGIEVLSREGIGTRMTLWLPSAPPPAAG